MPTTVNTKIINNYRKERTLTVAQFCKECHISKNTYYKFMKSQLSELRAGVLYKIATTTKISCDDILDIK